MSWSITDSGSNALVTAFLIPRIQSGDLVIGLCGSPGLSGHATTVAEVEATEIDTPGYSRRVVTSPGWIVTEGGQSSFLVDPVMFPSLPSPGGIWSAFLYSIELGKVLFTFPLPDDFHALNPGVNLRLDLGFMLSGLSEVS